MEKLPMCRICLVNNVRMYVVVNENLHELYQKLTDVPFVTEDSRPMLACFFCCTKLKQCYRFLIKCLKAEELFAQIMNEDCEADPLINPEHLEFSNGFVNCPIEHISIDDGGQTESDVIKEESPAVWKRLDKVIGPEEEHQTDELKLENVDNSYDTPAHEHVSLMKIKTEVEDKQESIEFEVENVDNIYTYVKDSPAHHSENSSESEDVPLMKIKTEVEDEQESIESELENVDNCYDLKDTSAHHSVADSEDDKSIMEIKIEVEDEQEPIGRDDEATTSTSTGSRGPRGKNAQYYRDYRARKRAEQKKESLNRTSDLSTTADSSTINVPGSVTTKKRKSAAEYQREYRARKKAKRDNILIDSLAVIPSISTGGFTTTHQSTIVDQLPTAGPSINPQATAGPSTSSDIGFAKPRRRKTPAEYQREYRARKKGQRESTRAAKTNDGSMEIANEIV